MGRRRGARYVSAFSLLAALLSPLPGGGETEGETFDGLVYGNLKRVDISKAPGDVAPTLGRNPHLLIGAEGNNQGGTHYRQIGM